MAEKGSKEFLAGRRTFIQEIPKKVTEIHEAWDLLCQRRTDREQLKKFQTLINNLANIAQKFGFITIARKVIALQKILDDVVQSDYELRDLHQIQIAESLRDLEKSALMLERMANEFAPESNEDLVSSILEEKRVFLLCSERKLHNSLEIQLKQYGYEAVTFQTVAEMKRVLEQEQPLTIIVDVTIPPGHKNLSSFRQEMLVLKDQGIPIIFLVIQSHDLKPWVEAVRCGATACLVKPPNIHALVTRLDYFTKQKDESAYRILVVDDDESYGLMYGHVLEAAGMQVRLVTKPLTVMQQLIEFKPDLILMAERMADCSGIDLARVIRQYQSFATVPILYLAEENNKDQMDVLTMGGYDFLVKPVNHNRLVLAVNARVQWARDMRTQMERDALTGVLNYATLQEQLEIELSRAQRGQSKFVLALIDIDNFRTVNRTYGYPTGDVVLQSLAQLLKGRLRKTDAIGRFGGEEFAVILQNADNFIGTRVLNELRWDFARISQQFKNIKFHVTFSAGLASYPDFKDEVSLLQAAERGLRIAKEKGRNQVICADPEMLGKHS